MLSNFARVGELCGPPVGRSYALTIFMDNAIARKHIEMQHRIPLKKLTQLLKQGIIPWEFTQKKFDADKEQLEKEKYPSLELAS